MDNGNPDLANLLRLSDGGAGFHGEGEGGLQPPRLDGDYYGHKEEVKRSVTLVPSAGGHAMAADEALRSDFDFKDDFDKDVVRGVTIGADHYSGLYDPSGAVERGFHLDDPLKCPPPFAKCPAPFEMNDYPSNSAATRFSSDGCPPPMPDDPFFTLATTTLELLCEMPDAIGNALLDFLSTEVISSVSKVNTEKFRIKAEVLIDNVMATLKIKIYEKTMGRFAVEFQRRGGDCVVFHGVYKRALRYLQSFFHGGVVDNGTTGNATEPYESPFLAAPPAPPPPPLLAPGGGRGMQLQGPLLDMASQQGATMLQAEAAAGLAALAEESVSTFWSDEVIEAVKELLEVDDIAVAAPTGQLIQRLAEYPGAAPYFAGQDGLLAKVVKKLGSSDLAAASREPLAQAVSAALAHCLKRLSDEETGVLSNDLSKAIDIATKESAGGATGDGVALLVLKEAATRLRCR